MNFFQKPHSHVYTCRTKNFVKKCYFKIFFYIQSMFSWNSAIFKLLILLQLGMDKMDSTSPTSSKHSRIHTHHRHRETYAPVTEILVPTVCAGIPAPKPASRMRHTSLSRSDSFDSSEEHWVGFYFECWNLFVIHLSERKFCKN